jgi:hypothetical protein
MGVGSELCSLMVNMSSFIKFEIGNTVIVSKLTKDSSPGKSDFVGKSFVIDGVDISADADDYIYHFNGNNYYWCEAELDFAIIFPDRVCSVCNKSCPHGNPDQNNKYTCISCIIIKDFENEC